MNWFLNSSFAQDIGMTLVHSIWQILLIAAAFAVANRMLARRSANSRYIVAYSALLLMLLLPLATLVWNASTSIEDSVVAEVPLQQLDTFPVEPSIDPIVVEPTMIEALPIVSADVEDVPFEESQVVEPDATFDWNQVLPWLSVVWSLGVMAFSLRPLLALRRCRTMRKQARPIEVPWVTNTLVSLSQRMGLKRKVEIASSQLVKVPTVLVFLRPIILLPVSMLSGQTPEELSAIIAHELAHIRRHDFLLNLFQTMIETLLFYHPCAWWVSLVVRQERENCCDDIAMSICGRKNYATALANLEFARSNEPSLAMAADGGSLYRRIRRIVRPNENPNPLGRWLAALIASMTLLIGIVAMLSADSVAEVANSEIEDEQVEVELETSEERTFAGTILDVKGKPIAGAKVYAEHRVFDRQTKSQVMTELAAATSDANGSYSLAFTPREGDNQIVAAKDGYGPEVANRVKLDKLFDQGESQLDLRLSNDHPINGRVVDTEGNPIAGVRVRVFLNVLPESEEAIVTWIQNEDPELLNSIKDGVMYYQDPRIEATAFPGRAAVRSAAALPADATTDADGKFRLEGVGANGCIKLELRGPTIATRTATVVAREMKNVLAFTVSDLIGDFTHHGATPSLIASPSQPVVGQVVDADSGEPLVNVTVKLVRSGKKNWVRHPVAVHTDTEGRFRMEGASLGGQHILEVQPNAEEPYFKTQLELPKSSGSAPMTCKFELPRTQWIRGRVTDEAGKPVVASLNFHPFRDNAYAKRFKNYDPKILGSVPRYEFLSDELGNFRIKAIPGPAVLSALVKDYEDHSNYVLNAEETLIERVGAQRMRKVFNGFNPEHFDALIEVNLKPDTDEITQDVVFTPALTRQLRVLDNTGKPLTKVQVVGLAMPPSYKSYDDLTDSAIEVAGLSKTESRLVALMNDELGIGKILSVSGAETDSLDVKLEPCAVVVGRLLNDEDEPVEGVFVTREPIAEDDWGRDFGGATTDSDGKFRMLVPPGGRCDVHAYSTTGPNFRAIFQPKPGATYDLGDLRHKDRLEASDTEKLVSKAGPVSAASNSKASTVRSYAGKVLLPNGKPAVGAEIHLVHWVPTPLKKLPAKPLTKTDGDGRFQFTLERDPHGEAAGGTIVAKLNDYAFAWALASALDQSGDVDKRLENSPTNVRETIQRDRGPMRLLADDAPVTGRIVDTEGNGVTGVSVYVSEVLGGPDNTMAAWNQVMSTGAPDFMKLQNAFTRTMRGPHVPGLVGETKTDKDGRFTIHGIGKDRVAKIVMQGAGIVSESVYARTSGGKTVVLPMEARHQNGAFQNTYHGNEFTMVAERSRPVVGRITNEDGQGVGGVVISSILSYSHGMAEGKIAFRRSSSDHVFAITDAKGEYRLNGLPLSKNNTVRLASPTDSNYLGVTAHVDTHIAKGASERYAPVKKDFELSRGVVVEGRVTDTTTGERVLGHFRFIQPSKNPNTFMASMAGSRVQRSLTDGTFRIVVPRSAGTVAFTAFERHKYQITKAGGDGGDSEGAVKVVEGDIVMFGTAAIAQGHALVEIKGTEAEPLICDLKAKPASIVTGYAVGPDGERLSNVLYTGRAGQGEHWWARANKGAFQLFGFDGKQPRRIQLFNRSKELAGIRTLKSADDDFKVKLKPWATVRGRILNEEGEPLASCEIFSGTGRPPEVFTGTENAMMKSKTKREYPLLLPPSDETGNPIHIADTDGRFEIAGLIAGETYHLEGHQTASGPMGFLMTTLARDLKLAPGEVRDLGDFVLKRAEQSKTDSLQSPAKVGSVKGTPVPLSVVKQSPNEALTLSGRIPAENSASAKAPRVETASKRKPRLTKYVSGKTIDNQKFSMTGTVVGPKAGPLANAAVRFFLERYTSGVGRRAKPVAETTTNSQGKFSIRFENKDGISADTVIAIASHRDYVLDWVRHVPRDLPPEVRFQLGTATRPVRGQIVDLEGLPLKSAQVWIERILQLNPKFDLAKWERDLREFEAKEDRSSRGRFNPVRVGYTRLDVKKGLDRIDGIRPFQTVRVGDSGKFELSGVSANQVVELGVSGDGIESTRVQVLPRDMKPLSGYYGQDFILPAKPGRKLEGVVVDAETNRPLDEVLIRPLYRKGSNEAVTDEGGRFVLNSVPIDDSVDVDAKLIGPKQSEYFRSRVSLPVSSGMPEKPIKIELTRGITVRGRVIDKETGQPVEGRVTYFSADASDKPNTTQPDSLATRLLASPTVTTNTDGTFSIPTLPGKGFLSVRANRHHWYRMGVGFEDGDDSRMEPQFNSRVPISVDRNGKNEHTIVLDRYAAHQIKVLDADGQQLTGFQAIGIGPVEVDGHIVQVHEGNNDEERHLMLIHAERRIGALANYLPTNPPKSVKLKRLARIRGQLPSSFTDLRSQVSLCKPAQPRDPKLASFPPLPPYMLSMVTPDEAGRFSFDVPPGVEYEVKALDSKSELKISESVDELRPGETRDMRRLELPFRVNRTEGGVL